MKAGSGNETTPVEEPPLLRDHDLHAPDNVIIIQTHLLLKTTSFIRPFFFPLDLRVVSQKRDYFILVLSGYRHTK